MQTNSRECLEHAELYLKRAAEVTDPVLKKSLIVAAERWKRLAAILNQKTTGCHSSEVLTKSLRLQSEKRLEVLQGEFDDKGASVTAPAIALDAAG